MPEARSPWPLPEGSDDTVKEAGPGLKYRPEGRHVADPDLTYRARSPRVAFSAISSMRLRRVSSRLA
jgi:hypothetical protein